MQDLFFAGRIGILHAGQIYRIFFLVCVLLLSLPVIAGAQANEPTSFVAIVDSVPSEGTSLDVLDSKAMSPMHLLVPDSVLQTRLKALNLQKGDRVTITTSTDKDGHQVLQFVSVQSVAVPLGHRVFALLCCVTGYLILCLGLTLGNPLKLIIGQDGHYSNSKFQIALWFGMLLVTYVATVVLRATNSHNAFFGNVGIPSNLLLLSGMSVLTFGAAKGITTAKVQAAIDAGIPNPKPYTNNPDLLFDLTHNDKKGLDIGDFQMVVVTLLAVVMYIVLVIHFLGLLEMRAAVSLPDVDTTILAAFGLGHGAYLTKKAVGNVGET